MGVALISMDNCLLYMVAITLNLITKTLIFFFLLISEHGLEVMFIQNTL